MKSNRQRRSEIIQKRAEKKLASQAGKLAKQSGRQVPVNTANLRPTNSFGIPDFVASGFYTDHPFECKDCGKAEVWTATQQKWWYEIAHGDVWTKAIRCRPCRKKEAARKADARRVQLEGLARKVDA